MAKLREKVGLTKRAIDLVGIHGSHQRRGEHVRLLLGRQRHQDVEQIGAELAVDSRPQRGESGAARIDDAGSGSRSGHQALELLDDRLRMRAQHTIFSEEGDTRQQGGSSSTMLESE
jgi:hypothetical protein